MVFIFTLEILNVFFLTVMSHHVHVLHAVSKIWKKLVINILGNVINRIFYVLDSEIWCLFHSWDRIFDIFTSANCKWNKFHTQCQTIKNPLYFFFLFKPIKKNGVFLSFWSPNLPQFLTQPETYFPLFAIVIEIFWIFLNFCHYIYVL